MTRKLLLALAAVLVACSPSCGHGENSRYTRKEAQKSLTKLEAPGLTIGEFKLTKVVDGDTIRVDGLDSSLRLLGLDTEETFDHGTEENRRLFEAGWESYKKAVRGASSRPVKFATPLGEEARDWASKWFEGVDTVRLERDHPAEIRDRYNRYLAYVLAQKNGTWMNYNVEAVRAGMAPYFPKYGQSRRFHTDFLAAAAEAKAAKRGIWAPGAMAYPDYDEREAWWTARGAFVEEFRKAAEGKPNYIDVTHWDALTKLEELVGKEVFLLGTVDDVRIGEKGPTRVTLARGQFSGFPLIFFDRDVFGTSGIAQWKGEFVTATGVPSIYENKHNHKKQVQIVIDRASQITLSQVPGLERPTSAPASGTP
jgi:endonuclease YncB( thermonuclease family)